MTGKLADTVMSVRNGEQIARKYQPVVYNPSTPAQMATRAKLKLLSQLSAVVANYIAIPRQGSVSSRNLFTKKNYAITSYSANEAEITLAAVQLTNSNVGLPGVTATRAGDSNDFNLSLDEGLNGFSRVVYVLLPKGADGKLRQGYSIVVSEAGSNHRYATSLSGFAEETVVLAYAMRDNTEAARVALGNLEVPVAETVANLIVTRNLTEADVTLTETRGTQVAARGTQANVAPGTREKK